MICLNKVKPSHHIWSCDQCWAVFHLKCIKSWIQRCNSAGGLEFDWACPGCRYHRVERMPEYTCYCKKVPEPELNPHWLAHSCGEVCEKDRGCPHPCPELCHPGPCARCTAVGGPGSCHCGREQTATTRCGDPKQWSCGAACGQALSCGTNLRPLWHSVCA
ncbi:Transcriptional repressor NF-X1 homolog [Durusdinium trenchii]|uniref:Transcriptional repressor NF-X1 homolog n=1 Tax=Durusdinium trenchii TaxID=1381693 RepID=A0ABP0RSZ3_9DINO